jgi:hypothetical protein
LPCAPPPELERRAHEEALAASGGELPRDLRGGRGRDLHPGLRARRDPRRQRQGLQHYGYTARELRRVGAGDISGHEPPYTNEDMLRLIAEVRAGRGPLRFEWRRRNRDGSLGWDEVTLKKVDIAAKRTSWR